MKSVIVVTYLSCLIVEGLGMGYNCELSVPNNCLNNPRIGLSKSNTHYRLSLCSEGQCLPSGHQRWIECSDICEICRSLPGSASCTSHTICEERVDEYLNSYCESALLSTVTQPGPTTTVTGTQAPVTVTRVETTTTTSILTITITPTSGSSSSISSSSSQSGQGTVDTTQNSPSTFTAQQRSEFALAALLGLSVIVLMAVIVGWVLTCLLMKKKAAVRGSSKTSSQMSFSAGFDTKKYFKNPVYESSNEKSPSPSSQMELVESLTPEQQKFQKVKYDRILAVPPSQIENERKYDVLNRQPTFPGTDPSVTSRIPHCIQKGNNVEGQISTPPVQYSYSQLDHKNTNLENHYCATTLVE